MAIEVTVDRDVCMGSGNCLFHAEEVFDLDDDGVATVVDPNGAPLEKVVDAAKHCPTGAISVTHDGEKLV